jgi:hypothetical protein
MAISRRPVLLYLPLIPYDFLHFFTYPLDFLFAGFPLKNKHKKGHPFQNGLALY